MIKLGNLLPELQQIRDEMVASEPVIDDKLPADLLRAELDARGVASEPDWRPTWKAKRNRERSYKYNRKRRGK